MTDPRFDGPGPDAAWEDLLGQGVFAVQFCGNCGIAQFPPGVVCRHCGGTDLVFQAASGEGTVYSTTTVRSREGGRNVAVVQLAEGPRMMSRVEGDPETVTIGLAVVARISGDETPVVVFDRKEQA
ncbi:Zn-ribbon domain-containing OB-fold protein [Roseibium aggregatum]|uniref:OB-fold domain-containing protein n=1 Tax=Roseibium aggregatum TaxID=187304 RepID=A0A939J1X8_9HYPH|nr:OB-fold domain-containing protein [Roseibium aggregatum]MBN9670828.1 OB-fold domain-containing protein [Roseibium aggregatum]